MVLPVPASDQPASWVVAAAIRVWRRRDHGLAPALKTGAHRPTLAVLVVAQLAYAVFRRKILTTLNRRSSGYQAHQGESR